MNYTPEDLEKATIHKSLLYGYSKSQVDDMLAKIVADYNELNERLSVMDETVRHYKSIEEAMQHCFILAQHASDEMKLIASEKAKGIIQDAESTSQKMVSDANQEVNKIKFAYEDMKSKLFTLKTTSEALLTAQLDVLKQLES